jgi:hypothetical protein
VTQHSFVRTFEDLVETVKAIARLFETDKVFIIGSQSILLSWPDAPVILRTSGEIDAYPENARLWEIIHKKLDPDCPPEASEEINALFGKAPTSIGITASISTAWTRTQRVFRLIGTQGPSTRQ